MTHRHIDTLRMKTQGRDWDDECTHIFLDQETECREIPRQGCIVDGAETIQITSIWVSALGVHQIPNDRIILLSTEEDPSQRWNSRATRTNPGQSTNDSTQSKVCPYHSTVLYLETEAGQVHNLDVSGVAGPNRSPKLKQFVKKLLISSQTCLRQGGALYLIQGVGIGSILKQQDGSIHLLTVDGIVQRGAPFCILGVDIGTKVQKTFYAV